MSVVAMVGWGCQAIFSDLEQPKTQVSGSGHLFGPCERCTSIWVQEHLGCNPAYVCLPWIPCCVYSHTPRAPQKWPENALDHTVQGIIAKQFITQSTKYLTSDKFSDAYAPPNTPKCPKKFGLDHTLEVPCQTNFKWRGTSHKAQNSSRQTKNQWYQQNTGVWWMDRQTDGQTNRQTSCDSIVRTMRSKTEKKPFWILDSTYCILRYQCVYCRMSLISVYMQQWSLHQSFLPLWWYQPLRRLQWWTVMLYVCPHLLLCVNSAF